MEGLVLKRRLFYRIVIVDDVSLVIFVQATNDSL